MLIKAETLDDALHRALVKLLRSRKADSIDSTKGSNRELFGVQVRIADPRARVSVALSRSHLFSSLGELFWYLSASDRLDHISYYIPKYREESIDGETVPSAYGPRLFGMRGINQIEQVVRLLRARQTTRRAVIQLYDANDFGKALSPPCTCTLQFLVRRGKLNALVSMRSNDILLGFAHDVFAFTMIQEILCRKIGVELGEYVHVVGSLHLYEGKKNMDMTTRYLDEGFQERTPMPAMPDGEPDPAIKTLIKYEKELRLSQFLPAAPEGLAPYWSDIGKLLAFYSSLRRKNRADVEAIKASMDSRVYAQAIAKRVARSPGAHSAQASLGLSRKGD